MGPLMAIVRLAAAKLQLRAPLFLHPMHVP